MEFEDFFNVVKTTLQDNFDEADKWFSKSEKLRLYKPENEGWSINEILEHVSLTNHFLLILIDKAKNKSLKNPNNIEASHYHYSDEIMFKFDEIGKHKSFAWIRPEHHEPTGKADLKEVQSKLRNQQIECENILNLLKNGEGLNTKTTMNVNGIGKIDVYQYVYFLAMHIKRQVGS